MIGENSYVTDMYALSTCVLVLYCINFLCSVAVHMVQ